MLYSLQNQTQSSQILEEITKTLQRYPFDFRGAKIITGMEEGAYGWITINYLLEGFIKVWQVEITHTLTVTFNRSTGLLAFEKIDTTIT